MKKASKLFVFVLFISSSFIPDMYGQYDERDNHPYDFSPGVPPGGGDPDPAPIDDYIPLLVVCGLTLAYFAVRIKKKDLKKR